MGPGRRQVIWSRQASVALDGAIAYISQDSPSGAFHVLETALQAASSLAEFADRGRVVPEVASPSIREVFVFKYRLMYEITPQQVQIIAFVHGAREFRERQSDQSSNQE